MSYSYHIYFSHNVNPIFLLLEKMENSVIIDRSIESQKEELDLPFFDLATIEKSTDNFSSKYKLGEGGFGPVYKVTYSVLV